MSIMMLWGMPRNNNAVGHMHRVEDKKKPPPGGIRPGNMKTYSIMFPR
jgi:hypothetical protein